MQYKGRYFIFGIFVTVVLGLFVVRLFNMQFVHGEENLTKEQEFSRKEVRLTGARGKIVDSNGLPLAYNKTSYNVDFIRDPYQKGESYRKAYTNGIIKAIDIIEKNGGKTISTFAIKRDANGKFTFDFGDIAKDAAQKREENWRKNIVTGETSKFNTSATPEQLYQQLREYYFIPDNTSYEQAVKILSIWQEVCFSSFSITYNPVTIAEDVNSSTVAEIEIYNNEIPGMQISQSRTRVYPNKSLAAQIIGYMGRMLDENTIVTMQKQGYQRDDLIGVAGIESTMEYELSGNITERTGTKVVEVDSKGKVVRELESDNREPKAGNNVMLTIDSKLQKRLEDALAENIAEIKAKQESLYQDNQADYDEKIKERGGKKLQLAKAGGAIVMDVQTGSVLAMASYPTFDLNLFTGGISEEDMKALKEDDSNPLFNYAISSRATPGSVFKMVTGLAGLMEGVITPDTKIDDKGEYRKYITNQNEHGPTCWVYPNTASHQDQNIVLALKNSCNYFFYTVADGLRVDRLNKWADLLGLTSKTNIKLPGENVGQVGNQKTLYDPDSSPGGIASLVYKQIYGYLKDACENSELHYQYKDEKYDAVTRELMQLVMGDAENWGPDIRAILKNELQITQKVMNTKTMVINISASLTQIKWNPNDTIATGIGQSVTMVTPIEMVRYIAALVNGGEVYEARLVKEIITPDGEVRVNPPSLVRKLNVQPTYLSDIKQGMKEVVSGEDGTATKYFSNFSYQDQIGGKTGTAQVSRIDLENNSWFVAFAPFDKPEIAVVVYIPNGYSGGMASYTAQAAIQYYLDMKQQKETPVNMPAVGSLVK